MENKEIEAIHAILVLKICLEMLNIKRRQRTEKNMLGKRIANSLEPNNFIDMAINQ